MPYKAKRICSYPGCHEITSERYCEKHTKQSVEDKRHRDRQYDLQSRDQKAAAFYNSRSWLVTRRKSLSKYKGLCLHCFEQDTITFADVVDHIVPLEVDWSLRLVLSNLQPLCYKCHAVKTEEDKQKYKNKSFKRGRGRLYF